MLKLFFKFLFSGFLLWYLYSKQKFQIEFPSSIFHNWPFSLAALFLLLIQTCLISYRFQIFIERKYQTKLNFLKMYAIYFIGSFFNLVLPGAVSGDLVKYKYLKSLVPEMTKSFFVVSVLFDRVFALLILLIISGLMSLFNYDYQSGFWGNYNLFLSLNFLFLLGAMFGLTLFFTMKENSNSFTNKMCLKIGSKWEIFLPSQLIQLKNFAWKLMTLSFFAHILYMGVFTFLTYSLINQEIKLFNFLSVLPLGFVSVAIPVSPGGLGVGHLYFQTLLEFIGINNGAQLFNVHYVFTSIIFLLGIIPFLLGDKIFKKV